MTNTCDDMYALIHLTFFLEDSSISAGVVLVKIVSGILHGSTEYFSVAWSTFA